jgi:hypothetical protein
VVAFDNFATAPAEDVDHLTGAPGFQLIDHDVTEPMFTLGGFDVVLHLASAASAGTPRFRSAKDSGGPWTSSRISAFGPSNRPEFA